MSYHVIGTTSRSDVVLGRIKAHGREIRVWWAADNTLVGVWQSKNGRRTFAVGHNRNGQVIVYRASPPQDNWAAGSNIGYR